MLQLPAGQVVTTPQLSELNLTDDPVTRARILDSLTSKRKRNEKDSEDDKNIREVFDQMMTS